jgi:hypothetical protein
MRKVWKWVIGIVVALVVIAAIVGGAFLLHARLGNMAYIARSNRPQVQVPGNRQIPYGNRGEGQPFLPNQRPGMMPFGRGGWGMRGPGMMGFGWRFPLAGLIGCLLGLGILALVVLGIIWLVRRQRKSAMAAAPIEPVVESAPVPATHPCSRCGEPVQEGWKHCPNCGKRQ